MKRGAFEEGGSVGILLLGTSGEPQLTLMLIPLFRRKMSSACVSTKKLSPLSRVSTPSTTSRPLPLVTAPRKPMLRAASASCLDTCCTLRRRMGT